MTVYQKAGLIADLDALAERIENEDGEEVDGPSMGGGNLRAKYADLAQKFHDSALTIRIEGRSEREREDVVLRVPGLTPDQRGAVVLADAITSPKFTPAQVEKLAAKLGEVQFSRIVTRFHEACEDMPAVSADFLPKRSTPDDGGE
ncbi:hypothetical protein NIBR502772_06125 [Pseudarthrobacter sp. NIBRBAC000502772]|uniref:hypothetical protein n=1 Tax=Pseudarthrobacter sp. NIBRBAC000502772 TaxID=2590775 RepID=UPI0011309C82|nr:hypothetical protein [Pseudarthrobacter sp. NIBRBAC000502772]QDG65849.1 hypothetical protein NIBR502772_06125 [Pseudarthrobacter sp. NIBRBAC000502772]